MAIFDIPSSKRIAKALRFRENSSIQQQNRVLKKLLKKARFTEFGQHYKFDEILLQKEVFHFFQQNVPIHSYNKIYNEWWYKTLQGKPDICWPGKIKYYALSSGTSESSSKYIPVTNDLLQGNKIAMIKHLLTLRNYTEVAPLASVLGKGWLAIGGSTALQKGPGYYAGDLSGITARKAPFWFQPFYKPGKKIARQQDWNEKLEQIVAKAPEWDIAFIVGVPAWVQMCMEMIIERYHLNTIHDIWPHLTFFVHGGVSFEPYKKGFQKLLNKPLIYIETYLASEGFIAYQNRPYAKGMKLVTGDHIFLEFIPFNAQNFDGDGNVKPHAQACLINEVKEGIDYALLISTPAGAWRYLIGDTIRFTDVQRNEIIITGRTKHFLSIVGEHLSVDNMNKAVQLVSEELNVCIPEYTVAGERIGSFFAHHWYIACNDCLDKNVVLQKIDEKLKLLNDDYAVERNNGALKSVFLDVLPEEEFMNFMRMKGKIGGQHKFPRVLKGSMLEEWNSFLQKIASGNLPLH